MAPAKKLTITISEELAERLTPHRDRLNLSAIAGTAIEKAVYVEEERLKDPVEKLDGTLTLLREMRALSLGNANLIHETLEQLHGKIVQARATARPEEAEDPRWDEVEALLNELERQYKE